ncbi:hypothetical protein DINM_005119 [Dirofilaria immitis]|nr:hypothetical protein [Dirofilaria immitis]
MIEDQGTFNLINDKEAITTLNSYYDDFEVAFQHPSTKIIKDLPLSNPSSSTYPLNNKLTTTPTANFQRRSKDVAGILESYDVTSEKYELIRQVLGEKFGKSDTMMKSLYTEFYAIKRNDKEWKSITEITEMILRQLEASGKNLEHGDIETVTENRPQPWILDKKYGSYNIVSNQGESKLGNTVTNSINRPIDYQGKGIRLLCSGVGVINPHLPEMQEKALVLFDVRSQS